MRRKCGTGASASRACVALRRAGPACPHPGRSRRHIYGWTVLSQVLITDRALERATRRRVRDEAVAAYLVYEPSMFDSAHSAVIGFTRLSRQQLTRWLTSPRPLRRRQGRSP
jgi:hypothetical protein